MVEALVLVVGAVMLVVIAVCLMQGNRDEVRFFVILILLVAGLLDIVALKVAYIAGHGKPTSSESLTTGSVYEFVNQMPGSNGKHFLMLRLAEEGTAPHLYEYDTALPENQKYFQAVKDGDKKTLVPFPPK